ncbi:MAG: mechanosensitive ion channel [Ardenticatenaceae bacterium]|nr:mechanosensitive ion channel [Anaerolineales bacterium]MCB8940568.1 mechanosensitive ion channel [Ardenticatenaceae bacterium]MCB8973588.1 mechanosensitive ion channel [Ardenticatenaceae bacterium]
MPLAWMVNAVWVAITAVLVVTLFSRLLKTKLPLGLIGAALLTVVLGQGLILWFYNPNVPILSTTQRNIWLAIAFFMALSTTLRAIKWLLLELLVNRRGIKIPPFLLDISEWFVLLIVIFITIRLVFGVELTGLLVTSTVASAIIGLALQDTLGNLISGISLQIEAPFSVDDWVEIDGIEGIIVRQNWRTLTLLTREDHRVMLTNSTVAKSKIINYSRPTNHQIQTVYLTLSESYSPNLVKGTLVDSVQSLDDVKLHPRLRSHVVSMQDGCVTYGLSYWLEDYSDKIIVRDKVLTRAWFNLHRAGIHIPDPTGNFKVSMIPADLAEQNRQAERQKIFATMRALDWLNGLNDSQLHQLAEHTAVATYTTGEQLVKQGESGDSLFIITRGSVSVYVRSVDGRSVYANQLHAGDFFGEMSLLTGEARAASIRADEETDVIIINKEAFANVLTQDPTILERFVTALERRQEGLSQSLQQDSALQRQELENGRDAFIQRIRRYLRVP